VLMPVGHLDAHSPLDWEALVARARESVLKRLAREMGAADLESHIKFEIVCQPATWKERLNLVNGSAFGLSHNFWQVGYLRPHNRHAKYKNLYFAVASTHPGTGLSIVLLSARLTAERVLKAHKGLGVEGYTLEPAASKG
jgi:phytoene dehydrogenase-like protein